MYIDSALSLEMEGVDLNPIQANKQEPMEEPPVGEDIIEEIDSIEETNTNSNIETTINPRVEPITETTAELIQQTNNQSIQDNIYGSGTNVHEIPLDQLDQPWNDTQARRLAADLIHQYFTTQEVPLSKHHIDSYDQFLQRDLISIIKANNPIRILKNPKVQRSRVDVYDYKVEIFMGGESGEEVFIGTPSVVLKRGADVRALFPNECRLRNLTYAAPIKLNVLVKLSIRSGDTYEEKRIEIDDFLLCNMPLMLHSKYCMLHNKAASVLQQMGECPQDPGGYFIIDGSEKVLVTRQEGAFNTLWIKEEKADPNTKYYATISSLNVETRETKRVSFYWLRERLHKKHPFTEDVDYLPSILEVQLPFVLKPIPIFTLFRAMGVQTDKEILSLIFPDLESPEAKHMADLLIPSMNAAAPFLDTYSAIEYIVSLTKGFSREHVLDILHNHLFIHVEDYPRNRVMFLADCVRKILRVVIGIDVPANKDDTKNQRLLTSGFLCQMLFQNLYKTYLRRISLNVDEAYSYNESIYSGDNFQKIFDLGNINNMFAVNYMTDGLMRGFKGKWMTSANEEESGLLQELSRLSYLDFISHLRRAVLNFDTGMKLQGPRRLHTSQYGYFCTSETPSGASIGITKNLTIMSAISTSTVTKPILEWLYIHGTVIPCQYITPQLATVMVPVYVNSGIIGYTANPKELALVLRYMKRSGCLPPLSSSGFSIPERRIFIYLDEGRPLRPLITCEVRGVLPSLERFGEKKDTPSGTRLSLHDWRSLVVGTLHPNVEINSKEFIDPLADDKAATLRDYVEFFERPDIKSKLGIIEYLDPYEQNEALVANFPKHVLKETTHMEVHPSTILGLLGNCIPFPNHNQSPRNQLSASQSKQGLSLYATNWKNRFDNTANVLCYGEAPLSRTIYQDYFGAGKMPYGQNIVLAMGMYGGYNQEDGIIMNADALARGQFRSINYRSYEAFEEDDLQAHTQTRIANPKEVPAWLDLKTNLDYSKLDERGIIKVGEYVDQYTVIVGRYLVSDRGQMRDASVTPQVWTYGRVESVVVTVNNLGLRLVKIRIVQDRVPVLGDKFSNRHGQKGTLNVLYRGHDMPRTADGIVPDMIMNPTAIPSRMTIGQILEMMLGNVAAELGVIGNCTAFMNDGSPHEMFGEILEKLGMHKMCNQVLYNGMTGEQMTADIYMGVVYGMRLKHMTEDKWNARGQGRKEQRTRQPTGGRGNEGGLKIGEMERDSIIAHGASTFLQESFMLRSDGSDFIVCNGCGTIPLYNERQDTYICPLCDGPIQFIGNTASTLVPLPPPMRSAATFSKVEIPYALKLFGQEMEFFMNMSMRFLTAKDVAKFSGTEAIENQTQIEVRNKSQYIPLMKFPELVVPQAVEVPQGTTAADIDALLEQMSESVVIEPQVANQQVTNQLALNQQPRIDNTITNGATSLTETIGLTPPPIAAQPAPMAAQPIAPPIVQQPVSQVIPETAPVPQDSTEQRVINIDTSEAALAAEGLVEQKQSQGYQQGYSQAYSQAYQPMMQRPRKLKRPSTVQQGGWGGDFGFPTGPNQELGQEGSPQANPSAPVKVIKEG